MILIRQFDEDAAASKWANEREAEGYDLTGVVCNTVLRYDRLLRRETAETAIVVTMSRANALPAGQGCKSSADAQPLRLAA